MALPLSFGGQLNSYVMKVMIPVKDDLQNKFEMADGFHNIEFVCIYDSDLNSGEWMSAKVIFETEGGLSTALLEKEVQSIICTKMTPMVLTMFKRNDIHVFKAQCKNVTENIGLFQNKELDIFTDEESRQIQNCESESCSSCGSTCN